MGALDPGSLPGASIPGRVAARGDSGATGLVVDYDPFPFRLNGDPVTAAAPEPSTLAPAAIGGVGLPGYGWRRRKRA